MIGNGQNVTLLEQDRSQLLASMAEEHTSLLAIFSNSDLSAVYVNSSGRRMLELDGEQSINPLDFRLPDILCVSEQDTYRSTIAPAISIMGRWSGQMGVRSFSGSCLPTLVYLYRKNDYICLESTLVDDRFCENAPASTDSDFLTALLRNSSDAIYFKDRESRFLRASQFMVEKFGCESLSDLIGRTDFDFFSVEHAGEAFEDERGIMDTGQPIIDKEERETWEDGSDSWATTSKMPLRNRDGEIIGTFGISRDITVRKRNEEKRRDLELKLQLAHKLESIGSLAAGVAHEINTPTQFVSDNVSFLKDSFEGIEQVLSAYDELQTLVADNSQLSWDKIKSLKAAVELDYLRSEIPATMEQTLEGLARVRRIVGSLKEFAHPGSIDLAPADLNAAIKTTINVARHEWKYVAEVETDFDPDLPDTPCILDEFNQVVLNLIVNAAHAVEAANAARGEHKGLIQVRTRRELDCAVVEIQDTGTGISENVQKHVFEPFYTTKAVGKGTGQGLAVVQNVIVKHHAGTIEFDTKENHGTTFRIRIPITKDNNKEDEK